MSVHLSDEELAVLRRAAALRGEPPAAVARAAIMALAGEEVAQLGETDEPAGLEPEAWRVEMGLA